MVLSYDVAVFKWITVLLMSINTFAGICNIIDIVGNNNVNFHWKHVHFKGDKIVLRSQMIKLILHSWSFHMKFIKLAKARLINFI